MVLKSILLLGFWAAIVPISLVDYVLFGKRFCPKCGVRLGNKWSFLVATFLECLMFMAGIALGVVWGLDLG